MDYFFLLVVCLNDVDSKVEYDGYFYKIVDVLTILICGTLCGLKNMSEIHTYATSEMARKMFLEVFEINKIPSYSQMTRILKIVNIDKLNEMFSMWAQYVAKTINGETPGEQEIMAFDGKTIRSTAKMKAHEKALHIVSAHARNSEITIGQLATKSKSNEIPAVRDLIKLLDIQGTIVVADALNCQRDTAKEIIEAGADYVLSVKENQKNLYEDIKKEFTNDVINIETPYEKTIENNRGRVEKREAWVINDVSFLAQKGDWENIKSVGMINNTRFLNNKTSVETSFYISSVQLTTQKLLKCVRAEWSVEIMHWQLDVNLQEDMCRVIDEDSQKSLNVVRKIALNIINTYKQNTKDKTPKNKIMLKSLLDTKFLQKTIGFMGF